MSEIKTIEDRLAMLESECAELRQSQSDTRDRLDNHLLEFSAQRNQIVNRLKDGDDKFVRLEQCMARQQVALDRLSAFCDVRFGNLSDEIVKLRSEMVGKITEMNGFLVDQLGLMMLTIQHGYTQEQIATIKRLHAARKQGDDGPAPPA